MGHVNLRLLRWSKTGQLLALMWNPLQGANQLSSKPCRLKGATDKRGIGLLMGYRGKAFGDCAKVIMWAWRKSQKEGSRWIREEQVWENREKSG